ncbi:MAG: hypothetical protein HON23_02495 [Rickettsiales bacterium]|jgi:hypothetical protein|nr:hypothetical protein [Rickettsiales bacterium]
MSKIGANYQKIIALLASARFFSYLALCLIILLFIGTIAQKNIGLYLAHKKYFASFFVMLGDVIPFPGGYLLMSLMAIGLTIKLIIDPWKVKKIGTITAHLGVLTLLLGSSLTSFFSYEGNMIIKEQTSSNYINDYFQSELIIQHVTDANKQIIFKQDLQHMIPGQIITDINLPFQIEIKSILENTKLVKRVEAPGNAIGFAKIFKLEPKKSSANYEENTASISYKILSENEESKFFSTFENIPIEQILSLGDKNYLIEIRKIQTTLPFNIFLNDFSKESYPGTDKARNYKSYITIKEQDLSWQAVISMNQPLRYKGYSFYQSSYIDANGTEFTVLAVVNNIGRLFPYISTIIIALGILAHLVQHLRAKND